MLYDVLIVYTCMLITFQSCPTLCDTLDCGPPGSSLLAILLARILEWVAMPLSGDLPDPRIKPASLVSPASAAKFFTTGKSQAKIK